MSKLPTWTLEFFGRRVTIPYIVDCREIKAVVTMTDAAGNSGEVVFTADGPVAGPEEPVGPHECLRGLDESEDPYNPHCARVMTYRNRGSHD